MVITPFYYHPSPGLAFGVCASTFEVQQQPREGAFQALMELASTKHITASVAFNGYHGFSS
jgi:hypothetical protein